MKDVSVSGMESAGWASDWLTTCLHVKAVGLDTAAQHSLTSFSWNEVGSKYTFEKPLYRTKISPITEETQ